MLPIGISSTFCQPFEVGYYTGIGISVNNFDNDWNQDETHRRFISSDLSINYRFLTNKKIKAFVGSGLMYSNNEYYHAIQSLEYSYYIQDVHFSQKHISVPIRLGIDVELFGDNSFGFQHDLRYNIAINNEDVLNGSETAIFGSLSYSYTLSNRTKSYLSNTFTMYLRTKITNKLFLNTSVGYALIPITGDYDFETDQIQTSTDQDTGSQIQKTGSYKFENEDIRNNLVIFKIGLTSDL